MTTCLWDGYHGTSIWMALAYITYSWNTLLPCNTLYLFFVLCFIIHTGKLVRINLQDKVTVLLFVLVCIMSPCQWSIYRPRCGFSALHELLLPSSLRLLSSRLTTLPPHIKATKSSAAPTTVITDSTDSNNSAIHIVLPLPVSVLLRPSLPSPCSLPYTSLSFFNGLHTSSPISQQQQLKKTVEE